MIPGIIHFIFFTDRLASPPAFSLYHYLAVKSAKDVNSPGTIYFHYNYEPRGEWWQRIKAIVTPNIIEAPDNIHGNKLFHPAHQSDISRLRLLNEMGGIYLDLDTICVRPWKELMNNPFVIGEELSLPYVPRNWRQRLKMNLGLIRDNTKEPICCNAVLMSEKGSAFSELWLEQYRTFRSKGKDKYWNEHSGILSMQLALNNPAMVKLVNPYAFHYPLYKPEQLKLLFEEVHAFPEAYVHHLWESHSRENYLDRLTEEYIMDKDTSYNLIARRFL